MANYFSVLICYKNNKQTITTATNPTFPAILTPSQQTKNTCKLLIIFDFFLYRNHNKNINCYAYILGISICVFTHSGFFNSIY